MVSYDFTIASIAARKLEKELKSGPAGLDCFEWHEDEATVTCHYGSSLSQPDQDAVAAIVSSHSPGGLIENKAARSAVVDARTRELIAGGFSWSSKVFSLSDNAQRWWSGLCTGINAGLLTEADFPMKVNNIDDTDAHDILDVAEAKNMYATAVGTVKAHLGSGTSIKDQIRLATTQAELDAVVDNR